MDKRQEIIPWANSVIQGLTPPIVLDGEAARQPAVFIVGLPRSGTTLFHQLLVNRLRVGYIDNIIARFWGCPPVGIMLSKELISDEYRSSIQLTSSLGRTTEPAGPHEFGYYWSHWFGFRAGQPHYLSEKLRDAVDIDGLAKSLAAIQQAFRLPMVFKNLTCGFQADIVKQAYPDALFVYVDRNPVEIGRSILVARKRLHNSYTPWWSLSPLGWPGNVPKGGPAAEVAWQITECSQQIRGVLKRVNSITIHYDDILANPEDQVMKVAKWITQAGGIVTTRGQAHEALPRPIPGSVPKCLIEELAGILK